VNRTQKEVILRDIRDRDKETKEVNKTDTCSEMEYTSESDVK